MEIEHFFNCPYSWQTVSMILDLSVAKQNYVEDCEVCCNPIQISYAVNNSELVDFSAEGIEQ